MKAVLVSVQPMWCEPIAYKNKSVEIRKTRPKIDTPFKCYIYQTTKNYINKLLDTDGSLWEVLHFGRGKVIGEFVCDEIYTYEIEGYDKNDIVYQSIAQKIYDEDFDHALSIMEFSNDMEEWEIPKDGLLKQSCLSFDEIAEYIIGDKEFNFYEFYGWHISDLVIYDKPKELSEFEKPHEYITQSIRKRWSFFKGITRPPQSWCYVEEVASNENI